MADLIAEEDAVVRENEPAIVKRLKKLLMLSTDGTLNMHALWLIRREVGLPDDYRRSILPNHPEKLGNWQRLPYTKAYEKNELHPIRNVERLEKRRHGIDEMDDAIQFAREYNQENSNES
ncbi:hypothetical protein E2562_015779 [Oryza meyeriana var. granulata]|uniref:PORR domain-containing protein n=1 Tax=Oryza meyeriana var. granulata TaxID=110450 RepID=A0A6G1D4H6_9ORYZ|nr:hypothetical protein E2562_015779 [Oryza meyeriana var. granulata]